MLKFSHTYLYFKDLIRTYFCEIYVYFMGFFRRQKDNILIPIIVWRGLLPVDRSGRPTCTNVHASLGWWASWLSRELCSLEMALVDQAIDRQRAVALYFQARSTGRSTGGTTVITMTVGRSTGRSGRSFLTFADCQRAEFWWAINTHPLELF